MLLVQRQTDRAFEERRLLIERGVTDLPPISLPATEPAFRESEYPKSPYLKGAILLLFFAVGLGLVRWLSIQAGYDVPKSFAFEMFAVLLATFGLALLTIHLALERPEARERQRQIESAKEHDAEKSGDKG
jgi:hypothetical protein